MSKELAQKVNTTYRLAGFESQLELYRFSLIRAIFYEQMSTEQLIETNITMHLN